MNLIGKTAVVTGASRGIGYQITKDLIDKGFFVYAIARSFSNFDLHENIEKVVFDLKNVDLIRNLSEQIKKVDVLINNAGIMNSLPYDNYPEDKIDELMAVNVRAPIELIKLFGSQMKTLGKGRIVNVASVAGQIGHPDVWYGLSKAAVINFTKSYAKILGPSGVIVNCVAPSVVETDMMKIISEERKAQILDSTLLSRFAKPEDVSGAVVWLATDSPDYINGVCVDVNNGSYMR